MSTTTTPSTIRQAPGAKGSGARAARRATSWRAQLLPAGIRIAFLLLLLGAWQFASASGSVSALVLPSPIAVVKEFSAGVFGGVWLKDILSTLMTTMTGFAIGMLSGIGVGIAFAFSPLFRKAFYPVFLILQTFPKVAIAPLLVVWLGYGPEPKILIAGMLAFFPVLTAAVAGFTEVDRDELKLMASMQATRLQELGRLRIPNAMSYVFPALDVAVVVALIGTIVGELVGSADGIGHLLTGYTTLGRTASIYALLICLGVIGWTLHALVGLAYRLLPNWIVPKRPTSD